MATPGTRSPGSVSSWPHCGDPVVLRIEAMQAPLGAEITGLGPGGECTEAEVALIAAGLVEHQVLLCRDMAMTPQAFCDFADRLGTPSLHPIFPHLPGFPPIVEVVNLGPELKATSVWHSDVTFEQRPPSVTMLAAQVLPEGQGNTLFADTQGAFDALDADLAREIRGRQAEHIGAAAALLTGASTAPTAIHPVVREHPSSARPSLFVNDAFTTRVLDMDDADGRQLVDRLVRHATSAEFVYSHQWQTDDLVLWDNRSTLHFHVHDYGWAERRLLRITLEGDAPRGTPADA